LRKAETSYARVSSQALYNLTHNKLQAHT